ncbi:hypothetical protein BDF20DRAFT_252704 [Mycotypha africana]|uniref:uncharacterized protein n=1 Tax=Mycotypha africana TaxID=64632 RepID=UPI002301F660|nr:uncharacterized protein BDF20DRAFT_252704 [Mycotypha africana]KAI8987240.1 hypothetical protein BDF20DRAFT_252704 [Mycotypha africana]
MASQSNKIVKKYKGTKGRKHQTKLGRHVVRKKDDDLEDIELLVMDKLKSLMINHNYNDAKVLFLELLRTARFAIPNTWKLGAEILAKTSPERLTEYLKAVHINAPPSLQFKIFNVYIDRLMAEEDWTTAIDEMQLVYTRPLYNKPVVWRKLAISSFRQWSVIHQQKVDRDTLKDEASEDDESMDEDSKQDLEYERLTKATAHRRDEKEI